MNNNIIQKQETETILAVLRGQKGWTEMGGKGSGHWRHRGRSGFLGGSLPKGKIYTAGNPNWIRVIEYGSRFRASTNNERAYDQIASLSFRGNRADAQADLDKLANELNWDEVEE